MRLSVKQPIFISGLRKSGTSFIKNLLDDHPELFVWPANELHLFRYSSHPSLVKDKLANCENFGELMHRLSRQHFVTDPDAKHRKFRGTEYDSSGYWQNVDVEKFLEIVDQSNVTSHADAYETLFRAMAKASRHFSGDIEDVRFASKTVLETEFFPELLQWFPDLKFVYVMRNPYGHFNAIRRGMRKRKGKLGLFFPPYPYLGREIPRMRASYYFMRKWKALYPDQFYVLVYDRLLEDVDMHMRDLCAFLGIEFKEIVTRPTVCGEPWASNSTYGQFHGVSTAPLTKWKKDVSGGEIRLINTYFEDVLDEFEFEKLETRASHFTPFHASERPITYFANRALYLMRR